MTAPLSPRQRAGDGATISTARMSTASRGVRAAGSLLAVLAAGLWFVVLVAPGASAAPSAQGRQVAATPRTSGTSCPLGSTCATIPAKCPKGTRCPEVVLSPTGAGGPDQWVFISAENFPPGDPITVYYCSDKYTLA